MNEPLRFLRRAVMLLNGLVALGSLLLIAEAWGLRPAEGAFGTFLSDLATALLLVSVILVFIPYGAAMLVVDLFLRWKDPTPRSWPATLALPLLTLALKYLFYSAVLVTLTLP